MDATYTEVGQAGSTFQLFSTTEFAAVKHQIMLDNVRHILQVFRTDGYLSQQSHNIQVPLSLCWEQSRHQVY